MSSERDPNDTTLEPADKQSWNADLEDYNGDATTQRFGIAGKTAIVTGASRGIGRTIAERFTAAAANVVICSREEDHIDPVADTINSADSPGTAVAVECDVRNRDAVDRVITAAVDHFGGIDILVNNVGGMFQEAFEDLSYSGWRTLVEINLDGVFHPTQTAAEHLAAGGGSVINISSLAGEVGAEYISPYGAAKAGVINLTTSLATEWADHGIRVNCISPGFVNTPGIEQIMDVTADLDRTDPNRRIGTPAEIADIVHFLASPAASFITGETITAKGVPTPLAIPDGETGR